jgi:hypothetical protein
LARKLAVLQRKCDAQFKAVFDAIRQLMAPPQPTAKRRIGFRPPGGEMQWLLFAAGRFSDGL